MKNIVLSLSLLLTTVGVVAQDIYQIAELSMVDLNGTSRYVGMGGAMSSLGGDLSTMSSNPAATGLYRRSDVAATMSLVTQPAGYKFDGKGNTHVSFDQLGFIYSSPIKDNTLKYVNVGVNYHKMRNFNQLIASSATNLADYGNASQTWQLSDLCNYWGGYNKATPLAEMAYEAFLLGGEDSGYSAYGASSHFYNKARWGGNHSFDFNISFNLKDQYYLGLTVSGYYVNEKSFSAYTEDLITANGQSDGFYTLTNENSLKGTGVDAKFGFVVRPIRNSNFKVGISLSTPTYYELTYRNEAILSTYENQWGEYDLLGPYTDYDYKIRSPWRLNLSVGNTFFNRLALGAEYEFADYSSCSVSYGDSFDDWDISKDRELNRQADKYLRGTHTLKVGAELMVVRNLFVRAGYNYVSSMFDNNAYLNQYINSASIDAATSTDYLNTSAINRYTAGVGVKFGSFYADASWLYQCQHGDFYAFSASRDGSYFVPNRENMCPSRRVGLNKSQFALTLGYRF